MTGPAGQAWRRDAPTAGGAPPVVTVVGATKSYAWGGNTALALGGVDLTARPGEFVAIVGRSGSGKSTLANLVAGIDRPTSGRIEVAGVDLGTMTENQLAAWRGKTVGVVFQFFQLLPTLTVVENVMLPMELCRTVRPRDRRPAAMALLERVGVARLADKVPAALSGGEQQRSAVARALANDPPVLVADEPTGNLDGRSGEIVLDLLAEMASSGTCVLMVTHERDTTRWVSRTITLADGLVVEPSPAEPVEATR